MKILQCPVCKGFSRHPDNWESLVICQECNLANQAQRKGKLWLSRVNRCLLNLLA